VDDNKTFLTEEIIVQWPGEHRPENWKEIEVEAGMDSSMGPIFFAELPDNRIWVASVLSFRASVVTKDEGASEVIVPGYELSNEAMHSISIQVLGDDYLSKSPMEHLENALLGADHSELPRDPEHTTI
jgi:hypothetical protein